MGEEILLVMVREGVEENGAEFHVTERRFVEGLQGNGHFCCKQVALVISGWGEIPRFGRSLAVVVSNNIPCPDMVVEIRVGVIFPRIDFDRRSLPSTTKRNGCKILGGCMLHNNAPSLVDGVRPASQKGNIEQLPSKVCICNLDG